MHLAKTYEIGCKVATRIENIAVLAFANSSVLITLRVRRVRKKHIDILRRKG